MLTISQLAEIIGRDYETVSNWRKRGLMPFVHKVGRDYVLSPIDAFRVRLAAELTSTMDVPTAFAVAISSTTNEAIAGLTGDNPELADFYLVTRRGRLVAHSGDQTTDIALGLLKAARFMPDTKGEMTFDGSLDLSKASMSFLETPIAEAKRAQIKWAAGFSIFDLTSLWTDVILAGEKLSLRETNQ